MACAKTGVSQKRIGDGDFRQRGCNKNVPNTCVIFTISATPRSAQSARATHARALRTHHARALRTHARYARYATRAAIARYARPLRSRATLARSLFSDMATDHLSEFKEFKTDRPTDRSMDKGMDKDMSKDLSKDMSKDKTPYNNATPYKDKSKDMSKDKSKSIDDFRTFRSEKHKDKSKDKSKSYSVDDKKSKSIDNTPGFHEEKILREKSALLQNKASLEARGKAIILERKAVNAGFDKGFDDPVTGMTGKSEKSKSCGDGLGGAGRDHHQKEADKLVDKLAEKAEAYNEQQHEYRTPSLASKFLETPLSEEPMATPLDPTPMDASPSPIWQNSLHLSTITDHDFHSGPGTSDIRSGISFRLFGRRL